MAERSPAPSGLTKADFITGIVLIALGLATVVESLRMPRFEERNIEPYTAPGVVPGILGTIILLLGTVLFLRAARAGGWRLTEGGAAAWWQDPGARRLLLALVLTLTYAGGLVSRLPFWLATFVFVTLFVALFEWPLARSRLDRIRRLIFAPLYGAAVSAAVTFVFQEIFLVRLP